MKEDTKSLVLKDSRSLAYIEYGTGFPIFYFHGTPGSRFEAKHLAGEEGVRIIGVDRPGIGLSSYKKNRTLLDWPDDIVELADYLEIQQFSIVGFSGGAPYVLACAKKISERLISCGIVSGAVKIGSFVSMLANIMPWLFMPIMKKMLVSVESTKELLLKQAAKEWPKSDSDLLKDSDTLEIMAQALFTAFNQGSKGVACDANLIGNIKGINPEDIKFENIYLWHGCLDKNVPLEAVKREAARFNLRNTTYLENEGHLSLIVNYRQPIIESLIAPLKK